MPRAAAPARPPPSSGPTRQALASPRTCDDHRPESAPRHARPDLLRRSARHTGPRPPGPTPDEALEPLRAGNVGFITDAPFHGAGNRARRQEIAAGQHPFVVLVGCSDSRVSPEPLFGRGLGEPFIVRVAGNTVGLEGLASIEYAVAGFGVPLVVAPGHERCGAVVAAVEVVENDATFPGRVGDMVEPTIPAVPSVRDEPGDLIDNAMRANVRRVASGLPQATNLLAGVVEEGRLRIVGAHYDLEDGVVEVFVA